MDEGELQDVGGLPSSLREQVRYWEHRSSERPMRMIARHPLTLPVSNLEA